VTNKGAMIINDVSVVIGNNTYWNNASESGVDLVNNHEVRSPSRGSDDHSLFVIWLAGIL
jgi:hypothetical protein